jgi:hypothetical protein
MWTMAISRFSWKKEWRMDGVQVQHVGSTAANTERGNLAHPYDGIWIDMSEVASFCVGSCGTNMLHLNPVHPPLGEFQSGKTV